MIALQILFWFCLFLILHSYLLFPAILYALSRNRSMSLQSFTPQEMPRISVIIAAYNEEEVIAAKIRSVFESDFPARQLEVLVGSDASTDSTNEQIRELSVEHSGLRVFYFEERTGKPGVVNRLVEESGGEILVITDANVMLDKSALKEMIRYFRQKDIGLVDSKMVNTRIRGDGISGQERFYISREVRIKHYESLLWGAMMGPFGGCYAVRRELYRPVPSNFLVDDFYINMAVLEQGYRCISNTGAQVFEDVSNDLAEEFRRKMRISAGNFQNLAAYRKLLLPGRRGVAFCFWSHKVLRWIIPFLVILTLGISVFFSTQYVIFRIFALLQLIVLLVPVIDHFLRKIKIHVLPLRFISHFVLMNLALLAGFFRFVGGIKNNVWQPTRRNQN